MTGIVLLATNDAVGSHRYTPFVYATETECMKNLFAYRPPCVYVRWKEQSPEEQGENAPAAGFSTYQKLDTTFQAIQVAGNVATTVKQFLK